MIESPFHAGDICWEAWKCTDLCRLVIIASCSESILATKIYKSINFFVGPVTIGVMNSEDITFTLVSETIPVLFKFSITENLDIYSGEGDTIMGQVVIIMGQDAKIGRTPAFVGKV